MQGIAKEQYLQELYLSIEKAKDGDKQEMEKLIKNNSGLIWNIVKRFIGRGVETEDIYQIGCMGFIKAIKRFDTSLEVQLSTYAVPYILGEIKKFIRDNTTIKVSRSTKMMAMKIVQLQNEYMEKENRELSVGEIANILNISKEDVSFALEAIQPVASIYEEKSSGADDDRTILDRLTNNEDEATLITNKIVIRELINKLNAREKQVILLRFYRNKTQTEVSKILGITQVQVSRIERKILSDMKLKLTS